MAGGRPVGWGPTVRDIEELANLFGEVVHVAFLHPGAAPASSLPYSERVRLNLLAPAGGSLAGKAMILVHAPAWLSAIRRELKGADAVHVRCPSNISLLALLLLGFVRSPRPRWVKYAGNWRPRHRDAFSYRLQRWLLRRNVARSVVTVNGRWPGESHHVVAFDNPTFTEDELASARTAAAAKTFDGELRLVFAGRLDDAKGVGRALAVAKRLADEGTRFRLDLAGDGPDRPRYVAQVRADDLSDRVQFHGWLSRSELDQLYRDAHVMLLLSSTEGFPKVLAEAMAHGVVPVAADVSSIRQVLDEAGAGVAVAPHDVAGAVDALHSFAEGERWRTASAAVAAGAERFTYERYRREVSALFNERWGTDL